MTEAGLLADPAEVRAILIASAKAGQAISYAEVLELLGHHFTRPKMRALCKVLSYVDDETEALGEPELAVLVVRQSDQLPGQGWWVGGAKKHNFKGLWEDDDSTRLIFLGSLALGDGQQPIAYGEDGKRDMAGVLERIAPFRWRLVIPWPQSTSKLDVFELTPVAQQPQAQ